MRPRTLLILLLVVLGLGAFIWFYERELPSSEERTENAKKVLPLDKDEIRKVTLEAPSGRVVFERVEHQEEPKDDKEPEDDEAEEEAGEPESEWKITAPMQARADAFAVDGLLDSLVGLQKNRTLEDVDRKAVGLDKPRATVRVETEDGTRVLQLGAAVPTGGSLIAGLEGSDEAYVVSDTILSQVDREPGSWRDRQLFRAGRDAIARITVTGPGGKVVLAQQDGQFRIESPFADRADKTLVDDLYADLSGLAAEQFVDQPFGTPAEMGLQPPRGVVEVAFRQGDPLRIELGLPAAAGEEPPPEPGMPAPPPAIHARVGPQLVQTRTRLAQVVERPAGEWRARGLSAFEVHDIETATVRDSQGEGGEIRLTRAGTDWKRGEETISYVPVSDFLFALTGAESVRLLSPQETQAVAGQPVLTVELATEGTGKETLTLYPATGQGAPARVSGRPLALLLPTEKLQEIRDRLGDVRGAKPLEK
jgi:hypothetical protein